MMMYERRALIFADVPVRPLLPLFTNERARKNRRCARCYAAVCYQRVRAHEVMSSSRTRRENDFFIVFTPYVAAHRHADIFILFLSMLSAIICFTAYCAADARRGASAADETAATNIQPAKMSTPALMRLRPRPAPPRHACRLLCPRLSFIICYANFLFFIFAAFLFIAATLRR
jgi:hypothetical protein